MQEPEVHPFPVTGNTIQEGDIFEYREIRQKSKILIDDAETEIDPREWIQFGYVVTIQFNFTGIRGQGAGDDLDKGRFSGSIGTRQAMDGGRTNRQVHILQNGGPDVGL